MLLGDKVTEEGGDITVRSAMLLGDKVTRELVRQSHHLADAIKWDLRSSLSALVEHDGDEGAAHAELLSLREPGTGTGPALFRHLPVLPEDTAPIDAFAEAGRLASARVRERLVPSNVPVGEAIQGDAQSPMVGQDEQDEEGGVRMKTKSKSGAFSFAAAPVMARSVSQLLQ